MKGIKSKGLIEVQYGSPLKVNPKSDEEWHVRWNDIVVRNSLKASRLSQSKALKEKLRKLQIGEFSNNNEATNIIKDDSDDIIINVDLGGDSLDIYDDSFVLTEEDTFQREWKENVTIINEDKDQISPQGAISNYFSPITQQLIDRTHRRLWDEPHIYTDAILKIEKNQTYGKSTTGISQERILDPHTLLWSPPPSRLKRRNKAFIPRYMNDIKQQKKVEYEVENSFIPMTEITINNIEDSQLSISVSPPSFRNNTVRRKRMNGYINETEHNQIYKFNNSKDIDSIKIISPPHPSRFASLIK